MFVTKSWQLPLSLSINGVWWQQSKSMLKIFNRVKIFRGGQKKKPQRERRCGFFRTRWRLPFSEKGGKNTGGQTHSYKNGLHSVGWWKKGEKTHLNWRCYCSTEERVRCQEKLKKLVRKCQVSVSNMLTKHRKTAATNRCGLSRCILLWKIEAHSIEKIREKNDRAFQLRGEKKEEKTLLNCWTYYNIENPRECLENMNILFDFYCKLALVAGDLWVQKMETAASREVAAVSGLGK